MSAAAEAQGRSIDVVTNVLHFVERHDDAPFGARLRAGPAQLFSETTAASTHRTLSKCRRREEKNFEDAGRRQLVGAKTAVPTTAGRRSTSCSIEGST